MTVYLAWSGAPIDPGAVGPWESLHPVADDLVLVDSSDSQSRVYHELKWSLPARTALLVAELTELPKLAHVAAGTQTWLRQRWAPSGSNRRPTD